jgi:hypothetical protein
VTGRVVGPDGRPRANCTINGVLQRAAAPDPAQWARLSTYSGPDGTFTLPGLAPGVTCRIIICNGMTCGIQPAKEFTINGPGPIDLGHLPLPPGLE